MLAAALEMFSRTDSGERRSFCGILSFVFFFLLADAMAAEGLVDLVATIVMGDEGDGDVKVACLLIGDVIEPSVIVVM